MSKTPLDNENIVFIIERSLNKNVVVYEAQLGNPDEPLIVYWVDQDPEYVKKAGGKIMTPSLNFIEKKMAYGVSWLKIGDKEFVLTLVALPSKRIILKLVDGKSKAETTIAGKKGYISTIFVETKNSWTGPKVVHIIIKGFDVETWSPLEEMITP